MRQQTDDFDLDQAVRGGTPRARGGVAQASRYHPRMHRHDQQRLAKLVSEFIDGCGSEPPIYLIAIPSLSNPVMT